MTDQDQNGTSDGSAAATDGASSGGTSDFDAGFDSAVDLMTDLPQDAGADAGAAGSDDAAGAPGEVDPAQPPAGQQGTAGQQPPTQETQPTPDQQMSQEQLGFDSTAPLDQILQTLIQNEQQITQVVADQMFKLTDAEKEALETDAVATLPALGARVYVKALQASASLVQRMVPQMLQTEINRHQALMTVEQAFFQQFPQLDRWKHGQDIVTIGQALRQQNPQMPPQDLLRKIAVTVMALHGIQPAAPRRQGNGQQPFRPAPSGAPMGQPNLATEAPFMGLGLDYEE